MPRTKTFQSTSESRDWSTTCPAIARCTNRRERQKDIRKQQETLPLFTSIYRLLLFNPLAHELLNSSVFAGRDVSRALGMSSLEEENMNDNLEGLDPKQLATLDQWEQFYQKK